MSDGNRTVTQIFATSFVPPRGKCCPFLSFCVCRVWFGVFCRFFCCSSLLRVAFLGSFSLPLVFFSWTSFFAVFLRDTDQVVTGHPHTHLFGFSFSFFVSRRAFCFALFGRASCFLAFFSGCHSGPRAFLGFSLNLWGLSSRAPSEAFFSGREAARVFLCFSCLVFLFPLLFCFAATLFPEGPPRDLAEAGRGWIAPAPSPK